MEDSADAAGGAIRRAKASDIISVYLDVSGAYLRVSQENIGQF